MAWDRFAGWGEGVEELPKAEAFEGLICLASSLDGSFLGSLNLESNLSGAASCVPCN